MPQFGPSYAKKETSRKSSVGEESEWGNVYLYRVPGDKRRRGGYRYLKRRRGVAETCHFAFETARRPSCPCGNVPAVTLKRAAPSGSKLGDAL